MTRRGGWSKARTGEDECPTCGGVVYDIQSSDEKGRPVLVYFCPNSRCGVPEGENGHAGVIWPLSRIKRAR